MTGFIACCLLNVAVIHDFCYSDRIILLMQGLKHNEEEGFVPF